jgi:hypothetical protein
MGNMFGSKMFGKNFNGEQVVQKRSHEKFFNEINLQICIQKSVF